MTFQIPCKKLKRSLYSLNESNIEFNHEFSKRSGKIYEQKKCTKRSDDFDQK